MLLVLHVLTNQQQCCFSQQSTVVSLLSLTMGIPCTRFWAPHYQNPYFPLPGFLLFQEHSTPPPHTHTHTRTHARTHSYFHCRSNLSIPRRNITERLLFSPLSVCLSVSHSPRASVCLSVRLSLLPSLPPPSLSPGNRRCDVLDFVSVARVTSSSTLQIIRDVRLMRML